MFKRLANRVSSAVASVTNNNNNSSNNSPLETLKGMGFSEFDANHALQISGGNVDRAAEWLLSNATATSSVPTRDAMQTEDADLQRALAASMQIDTPASNDNAVRSAASRKAGQAALARFEKKSSSMGSDKKKPAAKKKSLSPPRSKAKSNGASGQLAAHHPNVHVPKRLSQHDKEDQILRCADRIAPHPNAVDTLLKSLKRLQENPSDQRFRSIDTTTAGFQRSLQAPGVLDFLKAMNYNHGYRNHNVLELSVYDAATLYLGISSLEQVQLTSQEYKNRKEEIQFDKEIHRLLGVADTDAQEAIQRANFMSKIPSEPTHGGGLIQVELGSESKVSRKFEGDDTLQDIIHWLGGHASAIPEKLRKAEWFLIDRSHANSAPYNIAQLEEKTLQYIGCWPSARLAVVPFDKRQQQNLDLPSSSRGLGAAPVDHVM